MRRGWSGSCSYGIIPPALSHIPRTTRLPSHATGNEAQHLGVLAAAAGMVAAVQRQPVLSSACGAYCEDSSVCSRSVRYWSAKMPPVVRMSLLPSCCQWMQASHRALVALLPLAVGQVALAPPGTVAAACIVGPGGRLAPIDRQHRAPVAAGLPPAHLGGLFAQRASHPETASGAGHTGGQSPRPEHFAVDCRGESPGPAGHAVESAATKGGLPAQQTRFARDSQEEPNAHNSAVVAG